MPPHKKLSDPRKGTPLRIGRELAFFGRNVLLQNASISEMLPRFFVNDPWELIAEAIVREVKPGKNRDLALSFRLQAEDYFRAATSSREIAVSPVLLYYAFLNLSKAFGVVKGNMGFTGQVIHGISSKALTGKIPSSYVSFPPPRGPATQAFQQLHMLLNGNPSALSANMTLGKLLPQILPGHRLWCYSTKGAERFLSVERFEIKHDEVRKEVWLNLYVANEDLHRLDLSSKRLLANADLTDFEAVDAQGQPDLTSLEQKSPISYLQTPGEALEALLQRMRNRVWETVKTASPYRKHYLYMCPPAQSASRLPQMLSIYLLMYFLSSVTRYDPEFFGELLDSRYGPFFDTFISEAPMQFLYLMASEILGREVSKPAII
jgi:hypothetical protein